MKKGIIKAVYINIAGREEGAQSKKTDTTSETQNLETTTQRI